MLICPFSEAGCKWEGNVEDYCTDHKTHCKFHSTPSENSDLLPFTSNASPTQSLNGSMTLETPETRNELVLYGNTWSTQVNDIEMDSQSESMTSEESQMDMPELGNHLDRLREQPQALDQIFESLLARLTQFHEMFQRINSNHDGTMIWKIPQFSQRKADAESGRCTSIFSLPFYSGRYGYKMCLRLYIIGDGIGKGTHLSLFFVVMRGEFDNILQWPFTHKVTFKLINQLGSRDIVDTFQPDPMSISFRKPKSDRNIASGCPRFVSHTELERGGFIVDNTIFIKCVVDTSTIRHP